MRMVWVKAWPRVCYPIMSSSADRARSFRASGSVFKAHIISIIDIVLTIWLWEKTQPTLINVHSNCPNGKLNRSPYMDASKEEKKSRKTISEKNWCIEEFKRQTSTPYCNPKNTDTLPPSHIQLDCSPVLASRCFMLKERRPAIRRPNYASRCNGACMKTGLSQIIPPWIEPTPNSKFSSQDPARTWHIDILQPI